MLRFRATLHRLKGFFRRSAIEEEMRAELQAHLDGLIERNIAAGMSPEEARHAASREFGGIEQIKERARDERRSPWLEEVYQDLRYAVRSLAKSPSFTITAVLTLALGIGVNAALFSVVNMVALRPLPVKDPDSLVRIIGRNARGGGNPRFSHAEYLAYRDGNRTLEGLLAFAEARWTIETEADTQSELVVAGRGSAAVLVELVSENYFSVLGGPLQLGRTFTLEENKFGAAPVIVLSNVFWETRLHRDPAVIGTTLTLDRRTVTVIGVASPEFSGQQPVPPAGWMPLPAWSSLPADYEPKGRQAFGLIGRLKPGITEAQAKADPRFDRDAAGGRAPRRRRQAFRAIGARSAFSEYQPSSPHFCGARRVRLWPGACHRLHQRREPPARSWRVAAGGDWDTFDARRQPRTDCAATAHGKSAALRTRRHPRARACRLDVATAAAGRRQPIANRVGDGNAEPRVLFGDARSPRAGLHRAARLWGDAGERADPGVACLQPESLRDRAPRQLGAWTHAIATASSSRDQSGRHLPDAAVVRRSAGAQSSQPAAGRCGIRCGGDFRSGSAAKYRHFRSRSRFPAGLGKTVRDIPGVAATTATNAAPFMGYMQTSLRAVGAAAETTGERVRASFVSDGFFDAFRIPLQRGRTFSETELHSASRAIVVSESLARQLWPGQDPVGRTLDISEKPWASREQPAAANAFRECEVIGVAGDIMMHSMQDGNRHVVYLPFPHDTSGGALAFVRPHQVSAAILTEIVRAAKAGGVELRFGRRHSFWVEFFMMPYYAFAATSAALGALALGMASVGLYGLMTFAVNQRVREIGVRMAMGATTREVVALFVRQGLRLVAVGLALGMIGGALFALAMSKILHGFVDAFDPVAFATVTLLFAFIALFACWLPARRATKVDPMVALRTE